MARNPKLKVSCEARARAIRDWSTFQIAIPDQVLRKVEFIDLDGVQIDLLHVGGKHAKDSIIVKVPHARVMFIGDCYYPPPIHLRGPGEAPSTTLLKTILDNTYDIYVEGHDYPVSRREYLEFLNQI